MSPFQPPVDAESSGARARRTPLSSKAKLTRWAAAVLALVGIVVAASSVYLLSLSQSFSEHIEREELLPPASPPARPNRAGSTGQPTPEPARPPRGKTESVNYVLMGSDSRTKANAGAGRSDTLMVAHLSADRRSAYLISFPRDMYVPIPGHGKNKINAAFAFGGAPLAVRTLEGLLDTRMDHVVLIDFDGFIKLTEELGGVTVVNKHASSSRGYTFPAGEITVRGDQALAYVRERYDLPNGDLDRAERQRDVVKAILDKALSADTVANPVRLNRFVAQMAEHLTVDSELTDAKIRNTALSLRLTSSDIRQLQAPISGFATVRGQSIDVVNYRQLEELSEALQDDEMDAYLRAHPAG